MSEEIQIPDYFVPITGWRAWRVPKGTNELRGVAHPGFWMPGKAMEAQCVHDGYGQYPLPWMKDVSERDHTQSTIPVKGCSCGLYGHQTFEQIVKTTGTGTDDRYTLVYGKVALWGKVIEHKDGWRAEKAYPLELLQIGQLNAIPDRLKALRAIYNIKLTKPTQEQLAFYQQMLIDNHAAQQITWNRSPLSFQSTLFLGTSTPSTNSLWRSTVQAAPVGGSFWPTNISQLNTQLNTQQSQQQNHLQLAQQFSQSQQIYNQMSNDPYAALGKLFASASIPKINLQQKALDDQILKAGIEAELEQELKDGKKSGLLRRIFNNFDLAKLKDYFKNSTFKGKPILIDDEGDISLVPLDK